MLKKVIGIYLILVAVLVGVHTVAEPLYHVSSEAQPYSATWDILNAMMIVALGIGIVYGYLRKCRVVPRLSGRPGLFNRDRLGEVAGAIRVGALQQRHVIRQQLQRHRI